MRCITESCVQLFCSLSCSQTPTIRVLLSPCDRVVYLQRVLECLVTFVSLCQQPVELGFVDALWNVRHFVCDLVVFLNPFKTRSSQKAKGAEFLLN